jgi:hypothetical protein
MNNTSKTKNTEQPSRSFLVRLRKTNPFFGGALTIIACIGAFALGIGLLVLAYFFSGIVFLIFVAFIACLALGVKLGYVRWRDN